MKTIKEFLASCREPAVLAWIVAKALIDTVFVALAVILILQGILAIAGEGDLNTSLLFTVVLALWVRGEVRWWLHNRKK